MKEGHRWLRCSFLILVILAPAPTVFAAEEKGGFGFTLDVDVEGVFSPTVRSVKIEKIAPSSPAAAAGIKVGDWMVEIEGTQVAGTKASKLKELISKSVGQSLNLRLKRDSGESYTVVLVAVRKSAQ